MMLEIALAAWLVAGQAGSPTNPARDLEEIEQRLAATT